MPGPHELIHGVSFNSVDPGIYVLSVSVEAHYFVPDFIPNSLGRRNSVLDLMAETLDCREFLQQVLNILMDLLEKLSVSHSQAFERDQSRFCVFLLHLLLNTRSRSTG